MAQGEPGPWQKELDDFVRAFGGAFLFGVPLLFTEEMWMLGASVEAWKLILFLFLALAINTLLAWFAGFKRETSFHTSLGEAVDAVAVGLISGTLVLLVLGRIGGESPLDDALGKIIIQAVPLSLGASIANAVIPRGKTRQGDEEEEGGTPGPVAATLNDFGATAGGAIFIGFAIAPTVEVPLLSEGMNYGNQVALVILSLVVTFIIVFAGEFSPQERTQKPAGPFQHPYVETTLAYAVSLLIAFGALFFFDQISFETRPSSAVAQMLVLGLPAAVGGAAGRLLV